jgi:hypothetical protein
LLFHFRKRSAHARTGGKRMASSAELLADSTHIDGITFGTHANTHFAIRQFFEKYSNDNAPDRAQVID